VFDDGTSVYLAWGKETPLPAILTQSEDRREGPINYRMSGEYIVISPVPTNLVLRYGNRSATLWPSRRIVPSRPAAPNAVAGRLATAPVTQNLPPAPPRMVSQVQNPPATGAGTPVRLANMTALYSDKLTDAAHEQ
jgi:hypothetical protein